MNTNIFDKISFWALTLVVTLLPVFFLPFTNIPVEISKGALLVSGLAVSVIFWAMGRFSDGNIFLPKSPLVLSGLFLVFALFLSAIFSKVANVSMFGTMLDVGTFWFMFLAFLLMLMSSITYRDSKKVSVLLTGMVFSSLAVLVFQGLYLFLPKYLGLGVLTQPTDNIFGSWHAFGFFAGLSSLISLFVIEFFNTSRVVKWVLGFLLLLSLTMVAVVSASNFTMAWALIGLFSLVIFVYKASISAEDDGQGGRKVKFPLISFAVVVVSVLFFMAGQNLGNFLFNSSSLQSNEVSPTLRTTLSITKSVLKTNPVLGIGPNKFSEAWASHKPGSINETDFWDVAFNSGSGLLPTVASTTGILGILSLVIFFAFFLLAGVQSIFSSMRKGVNYSLMAFFVTAFYLFVVSFTYSSGPVLILLAFAFTGVFVGFSSAEIASRQISISFLDDHRKSFFGMLFLIFIMIGSFAVSVKYGERFASVIFFRKAILATDVEVAQSAISKAVSLYPNDLYFKTYSQVYLIKMSTLIKKEASTLTDVEKTDLKNFLDQTVSGAQMATNYNSGSYLNFQNLGSVYYDLASLGVKDGYSKAVEAFKMATTLNPLNPRIPLAMSDASFKDGKKDDAKNYANQALTLKPDYVQALVMLAQISQSEGDMSKAISYAEQALAYIPNNTELQKYIDALKNGNKSTATPASTATDTKPKDETPINKKP